MKIITQMYGENDTQDAIDLLNTFMKLVFKPHQHSQQIYVNQFETLVTDFDERGIKIDTEFQRILFLQKIEGIRDPKSPVSTYYSSMCVQPKENRTLDFVKQQFLNLDLSKINSSNLHSLHSSSESYSLEPLFVERSSEHNDELTYSVSTNFKSLLTNVEFSENSSRSRHDGNELHKTNTGRPSHKYPRKRSATENIIVDSAAKRPSFSNKSSKYQSDNTFESSSVSTFSKDGSYRKNGVLVIPGQKPRYTPEQSAQICNMSSEERCKIQCGRCGQYFHLERECKAPGKQCYRCFNYGHIGNDCPFPYNKVKSKSHKIHRSDFTVLSTFVIDSAAYSNITNDLHSLIDYREFETPKQIQFNVNEKVENACALGIGSLPIRFCVKGVETILIIRNVHYTPSAVEKILSANAFNLQFKTSITLNVKSGSVFCRSMNSKIANVEVRNGMYYMHGYTIRSQEYSLSSNSEESKLICNLTHCNDIEFDPSLEIHHLPLDISHVTSDTVLPCTSDKEANSAKLTKRQRLTPKGIEQRKAAGKLWHRRLAHASIPIIYRNTKVTIGMDEVLCEEKERSCCTVCALAKFKRKSFTKERERGIRVGQIVHSDVVGPISPATFSTKNRYILIVINDYSRYLQSFVMQTRDQTPEMIDEAYREMQAKFPGLGQFDKLRCDKGGEFESNKTREVLRKYGAITECAETDVHEHNGTLERMILTLETKLRALLFESGFPAAMWGQLVDTATWIYNRTAHSSIGFHTPYEKYYGKPPNMSHMKVIGSKCFVYRPKLPRGKKWEPRSSVQYLVGYTSTSYRTYDPHSGKTTEQCLVMIDEKCSFRDDFPSRSKVSELVFPERKDSSVINLQIGGGELGKDSRDRNETNAGCKAKYKDYTRTTETVPYDYPLKDKRE
jgi:hypothetical protein